MELPLKKLLQETPQLMEHLAHHMGHQEQMQIKLLVDLSDHIQVLGPLLMEDLGDKNQNNHQQLLSVLEHQGDTVDILLLSLQVLHCQNEGSAEKTALIVVPDILVDIKEEMIQI